MRLWQADCFALDAVLLLWLHALKSMVYLFLVLGSCALCPPHGACRNLKTAADEALRDVHLGHAR